MGTRRRSTATVKSRKRHNPVDADVRVEKVAKVREGIASGKYRVSASKVAAKVLDEMRRT